MPKLIKAVVARIEAFEKLDELGQPAASAVPRATKPNVVMNALSGKWLGHQLHPMLTDVPIGAWLMASVLDAAGGKGTRSAWSHLVGVGVLAAIPTAASGASDWSWSYGRDQRVGLVHAIANLTGTALQAASWCVRIRGHHGAGAALSACALALTAGAGYLGGHLTLVRGVGVNYDATEPDVSDWVDAAGVDELREDAPLCVSADGVSVVLVKHGQTCDALSAVCDHAGGPLDQGQVLNGGAADACIRCPWHGSEFRLSDGTVLRGPAAVPQRAWQVTIDDDRVLVKVR